MCRPPARLIQPSRFPPRTSRRAVSLAETRESAARNPDFEGSSTSLADQIAASLSLSLSPDPRRSRSRVAACTLSPHGHASDTYGTQLKTGGRAFHRRFSDGGTAVLCLTVRGGLGPWPWLRRRRRPDGRPASSLRTAPDLSFPMIDRCIAAHQLQQS